MNMEERHKLFRQVMWDYNISAADVEGVLQGKKDAIGHYNKQAIFVKLLESFSWFTIMKLFSPDEIRQLLSDDVIKKLRFKSLRTKYDFIQKRLQQIIPFADDKDIFMKVEFVNDVAYRAGIPVKSKKGNIDTVTNILSNKLTAIVGRDEPKDVFDIVTIAANFSFNWQRDV